MREMRDKLVSRVKELLADGSCDRVIGWRAGEFCYDVTPEIFTADNVDEMIFDDFCGPNQSKYLVNAPKSDDKKIIVLLKPCDSYSYNELITEHRIQPEKIHAIGVPCTGMVDIDKIRAKGIAGITGIEEDEAGTMLTVHTIYGDSTVAKKDVLEDRCYFCKGKKHVAGDEMLVPDEEAPDTPEAGDRIAEVARLEAMAPQERFDFWRSQLSKCIRCNACRNACPACTCRTCVFDNPASGVSAKVNVNSFEENMFHIIRAFHVAGRCTDCGECSRVCPQNIPLHLLNRKFIKDIDELYGTFQAGAEPDVRGPLVSYTEGDAEASVVLRREN